MIQKKAVIIYIEEEARNIGAASPRLCGLGGTVEKPSEAGRGTRDRVEKEQESAKRQIHGNLLYNRGVEGNERFAAEEKCGPKPLSAPIRVDMPIVLLAAGVETQHLVC